MHRPIRKGDAKNHGKQSGSRHSRKHEILALSGSWINKRRSSIADEKRKWLAMVFMMGCPVGILLHPEHCRLSFARPQCSAQIHRIPYHSTDAAVLHNALLEVDC